MAILWCGCHKGHRQPQCMAYGGSRRGRVVQRQLGQEEVGRAADWARNTVQEVEGRPADWAGEGDRSGP